VFMLILDEVRAPAKGSALKPGSKGALPPYLDRRVIKCA
jgi:hypothetical protein